jgi:lipopolysaccharide transport system ATP-binding protein
VGTGFHPELSGRENVFLSGVILGMKRAEIVKKFDEIVEFSGVEEFIDMPVKRYSSGMQVRLAFSVACHFEPEILLLDEVLAVGDAEFQEKSYQKMQAVVREGRTVVLVTHDLKAVRALCNSSLLLNKGSVVCFGPVNEALAHYQEGLDAGQSTNPASESRKIDEARLSGVRILSGGGREGAVASADPFTAEVQLFTETRLDGSLINLLIEDLSGEILSDIRTDYQDLRPTFQQGYHKLLVELPALHLSSGKYRLRFRISALDEPVPIWVDSEQKIFEVSGGPKTLGVVNPPVTWRLSGTAHPESVLRPH